MLISVFADASYHHESGAGGWGGWAKSERGSHYEGGPFKGRLTSSNDAEFLAAVNAVHMALKKQIALPGDHILLQSDCMGVGHLISKAGLRDAPSEFIKKGRAHLLGLMHVNRLTIAYRHVKGHSGTRQPRFAVNHLCDEMAGRGMAEARAKLGWRSC